jgi:hypothetical protein
VSLQKHERVAIAAADAEAARLGGAARYTGRRRRNHPEVLVTGASGEAAGRVAISCSPRADEHTQCNYVRQQVARILRGGRV